MRRKGTEGGWGTEKGAFGELGRPGVVPGMPGIGAGLVEGGRCGQEGLEGCGQGLAQSLV